MTTRELMIQQERNIQLQHMLERQFMDACENGNLELAQQLLREHPKLMRRLVGKEPVINSLFTVKTMVFRACTNNHLHIIQWLIEMNIDVDISVNSAFRFACDNNRLQLAKFLFQLKPDINISYNDNWTFCNACNYGYLELAQWLLQIKPDIAGSNNIKYAFCLACKHGELEVAKWLYQVIPNINESECDEAFCKACKHGNLKGAQWLAEEVKPERYEITDTKEIIDEDIDLDMFLVGKYQITYKIYQNNDRLMDYMLK